MVFYFQSNVVSPPALIYMGKDKFENEELIKHAFPEDIWFHVDKLSSAHVYLRLRPGETIDTIPEKLLIDCAQLVKQNSIEGCKLNDVAVVYTPVENLKKTGDMEVGQVGFHKPKAVKRTMVPKKDTDIIKRLDKTRDERFPDFAAERLARDKAERDAQRKQQQIQKQKDKEEAERRRQLAEQRNYSSVMKEEKMVTNADYAGKTVEDYEEDFM
eukprot:Colp12_sorted_trinity150504_noHs@10830